MGCGELELAPLTSRIVAQLAGGIVEGRDLGPVSPSRFMHGRLRDLDGPAMVLPREADGAAAAW